MFNCYCFVFSGDQNRPTPDMFHAAFDLIEFGEKNKYIVQEKLIVNAQ